MIYVFNYVKNKKPKSKKKKLIHFQVKNYFKNTIQIKQQMAIYFLYKEYLCCFVFKFGCFSWFGPFEMKCFFIDEFWLLFYLVLVMFSSSSIINLLFSKNNIDLQSSNCLRNPTIAQRLDSYLKAWRGKIIQDLHQKSQTLLSRL
jgi:hypothetical protein